VRYLNFDIVLNNLRNLVDKRIRCNLAVMLSFSPDKNITAFKERLKKTNPFLLKNFEEEYVFLYPHVEKRLKSRGKMVSVLCKSLIFNRLGGYFFLDKSLFW